MTDSFKEFVAGMNAVRFIRCMKHREVGQYNSNEATGAECPACHVEQLVTWQEAEVQRLRTALEESRSTAKSHSKGGPLAGAYQWFMQEIDKALEGAKDES